MFFYVVLVVVTVDVAGGADVEDVDAVIGNVVVDGGSFCKEADLVLSIHC